jgi:sec-independent protein translocase protein TatC
VPGKTTPQTRFRFPKNFPRSSVYFLVSDSDPSDDIDISEPRKPIGREKAMGFWEHIEELRGTLIKSIAAFVICATIVGFFLKEFQGVLQWPLEQVHKEYPNMSFTLGVMSFMEVFNTVIQMCVVGGLVLALPFILYFIAQFVAPALTEKEMKIVLPLCCSSLVLFLLGASFSFFLLMPSTIRVSVQLSDMFGFENRWTAGSYYNTLMWLVAGTGGVFEFPLVIVLLVWLGIMTTAFLRKYRRHAIVVIFIIAAVVTPTPDPFNQTLFAAPLYALFELSILIASRVEKKRARRTT